MSAGQLRMPAVFAWALFFTPGAVFVTADIVRLNITGLFLFGVLLLVIWLWLIGGLERSFWIADIDDTHPAAISRLDVIDGRSPNPVGGPWRPHARDDPQRRRAPGGS